MTRIIFTLVVFILVVAVALAVLQLIVGLLATILKLGVAAAITLVAASVVLRVVRRIAHPNPSTQLLQPGKEVQHIVVEREG